MGVERPRLLRFGPFELDVRAGQIRKHGVRIRLQEQSFQILLMLLEHPGEAVLREEIRQRLWPNNTIVEFDHSINAAIKRLRNALGESAEDPRYIETLAKRGYRFLGEVERIAETGPERTPAAAVAAEAAADGAGREVHYRLLDKLGEGGMGVVYRAEDLKLGRQVALKFLPDTDDEFSDAALRRFEREARAASALNHPNICTIHGLENFEGRPAIVMELVEGQTLAARLAKGRMALDEALSVAIQIASAMAEAHRKGIVHRDLKPGNIMLTGRTASGFGVKVLDFGLAKMERAAAAADRTVTMQGTVVGTPYYMSPEQAQGQEADARSDIFSFGVVLFEMLAAKRPFEGQNAASITAAILEREPLPLAGMAPPALDRLVRRCLAKDPEDRWQSARDLMAELQWIAGAPAAETSAPLLPADSPLGTRLRWAGIGVLSALAIAFVAVALLRQKPVEPPLVRFPVFPPENAGFGSMPGFAVSPDGRRIVFCNLWKDHYQLWLRSLDSLTAVPLPATEGLGMFLPFWSPDSRSIAFFADQALKRIDLNGPSGLGPATTLCQAPNWNGAGGSWNRDGVIIFSPGDGLIYRVRDAGGSPTPITKLDTAKKEKFQVLPWFLPDGRHFLFGSVQAPLSPERIAIRTGSLDSTETRTIMEADSNAIFVQDHLLFVRDNILLAQPFDPRRQVLTGEPARVAEQIEVSHGGGNLGSFSGSEGGVLAYLSGADRLFEMAWFDRANTRLSAVGQVARASPGSVEFSPDQRTLAFTDVDRGNSDVWLYDVAQSRRTRFTFDPATEMSPIWSPDGKSIVFASNRKGRFDLYRRASDQSGPEELLFADSSDKYPTSWSPDGKFLLYSRREGGKEDWDIGLLPLSDSPLKAVPFLETRADESNARFSPDGKWVAYQSDESGALEIYLTPFQGQGGMAGGKRQVSTAGGGHLRWRKDGKELFYISGRRLMSVAVDMNGGGVRIGEARQVIGPVSIQGGSYDVTSDGQRFLILMRSPQAASRPLTVVENWTVALTPSQK